MKKSEEIPEKLDYSKLPDELEEVIQPQKETITEEAKITYDGRQYLVRFPTEISKLLTITNQDKIKFTLTRPRPRTDEKPVLEMELIQDAVHE